jgi:predicted Fe-Mo cluster-binding NifX family protein
VYDNTFVDDDTKDILDSHSLIEECHCDFCGQRIKYVSVLEFNKKSVISYFQIGRNCMSYLFEYGMKINGLEHARYAIESAVKKLMAASTERARAEKYKKEFGLYLTWLNSLGKDFIQRNSFLKFIDERLRTGNGVVTMKMMEVLESMIKKYTPRNTENINEKQKNLLRKIDGLLLRVAHVYNTTNTGTYKFINSVRQYVEKNGNATQKQLTALNKVLKQVQEKKENVVKNSLSASVEIPW